MRKSTGKTEDWEQYATKHPIASSISSVIISPFQGLDYLRLGIENVGHNNVNDLRIMCL